MLYNEDVVNFSHVLLALQCFLKVEKATTLDCSATLITLSTPAVSVVSLQTKKNISTVCPEKNETKMRPCFFAISSTNSGDSDEV